MERKGRGRKPWARGGEASTRICTDSKSGFGRRACGPRRIDWIGKAASPRHTPSTTIMFARAQVSRTFFASAYSGESRHAFALDRVELQHDQTLRRPVAVQHLAPAASHQVGARGGNGEPGNHRSAGAPMRPSAAGG